MCTEVPRNICILLQLMFFVFFKIITAVLWFYSPMLTVVTQLLTVQFLYLFYICISSIFIISHGHISYTIQKYYCMIQLEFVEWLILVCFVCRNFMVITLPWIHICFPSIFWVAARYGRRVIFKKFICQVVIQQVIGPVQKNSNIFSAYTFLTKRVEIGIPPSYPEQLKDWQLSFYLWRNVPWFVISFHQRQQRDLQNVLRYGIPYRQF